MTSALVHVYTATSAVLALLALLAVDAGDYRAAFAWLAAAVVVDATDGWLARRFRVKECVPHIDGARLDDIVDYLTYVFVPLYLIDRAGLLPPALSLPLVGAALLASAWAFARVEAKTQDHFFLGFPSYWNIVALYMVALESVPWTNAVVLGTLTALVFVPIRYVYPTRTVPLRPLTLALGLLWGAAMLALIWQLPAPALRLAQASLIFPVYYLALSPALQARRRRASTSTR